jgi:hypothetical protein
MLESLNLDKLQQSLAMILRVIHQTLLKNSWKEQLVRQSRFLKMYKPHYGAQTIASF